MSEIRDMMYMCRPHSDGQGCVKLLYGSFEISMAFTVKTKNKEAL